MSAPTEPLAHLEADPVRLIDMDDDVGRLLREEASRHPGPSPTFAGLRAARRRSQTRRSFALALAVLAPVVVLALRPAGAPTEIVAESILPIEPAEGPTERPQALEKAASFIEAPSEAEPRVAEVRAHPQVVPTDVSPPRSSSKSGDPGAAVPSALDCSSLSRKGRFDEALSCLERASRTSGMGAELALLESARLRRHVTGDVSAALADLERYEREFPSGALRREAGLLKLEVLRQLGKKEMARESIARLLPDVPEQRTELLLQQFELDLALSDCEAAKATLSVLRSGSNDVGYLAERLEQCRPPGGP